MKLGLVIGLAAILAVSHDALAQSKRSGTGIDRQNLLPGIQGKDDRTLPESTAYPWSAIGRLNFSVGGWCTGTVIAPRKVLTAAHCLWNPKTRDWIPLSMIHFAAGYNRGRFLIHARAESFTVYEPYAEDPDEANYNSSLDWAIVTLRDDVSPRTGTIPLRAKRIPDSGLKKDLVQAGYSQDRAHVLTVNRSCGVAETELEGRVLYHLCDATQGDSGSPIFRRRGETYEIVGLHVATTFGEPVQFGVAVSAADIAAWLAENPKPTRGPESARAGKRIIRK